MIMLKVEKDKKEKERKEKTKGKQRKKGDMRCCALSPQILQHISPARDSQKEERKREIEREKRFCFVLVLVLVCLVCLTVLRILFFRRAYSFFFCFVATFECAFM